MKDFLIFFEFGYGRVFGGGWVSEYCRRIAGTASLVGKQPVLSLS